jgi:prepilin signal peptidase PulO-like enzyme (type II secretory pathway)
VYGLSSIFISVWAGSLYGIFILFKARLRNGGKHITMKTEIPFGPFLILGFLIVYFSKIDVTNLGFILENFS